MQLRDLRRILTVAAGALAAVLIAVSIIAAIHHSGAATSTSVPAPLAAGSAFSHPRPLPRVQLVNAAGSAFSPRSWRGRWVILAPTMTLCHEVCPMTTAVLNQVQADVERAGLGHRVVVATATVDPWRDRPSRLRAYARLTGATFQMLTGRPAEIRRLWRFFGVAYHRVPQGHPADVDWLTHRPETFDVEHTDALFLIDPAGQERIADDGMPSVDGRLPAALRVLLNDQGRQNLAHPQFAWSAADVIDDLYYLMGRRVPGASAPTVRTPSPAAARAELTGSPGALTALHDQAARLLGSDAALRQRLRSLHGYPVVINAWASWCTPCRTEFPLFATASARFGRRVAFLGVNVQDTSTGARGFLAHHPVSYPSYSGSTSSLDWLAQIEGMPTTIFVGPAGGVRAVHTGQYQTQATLDDDIARYAG